jgi:hypothetical protein
MATRRQFLKTGLIGGALLATAFALHKPLDRLGKRTLVEQVPIAGALPLVVAAVAPVMLAGVIAKDRAVRAADIRRVTDGVGVAVAALSAASQREVAELFALLAFAPTRILAAGMTSTWPEASEDDIRAFLERWRHSPIDLLKSGYMALHDLILGAWYADSAAWEAIGYLGPPGVPHA